MGQRARARLGQPEAAGFERAAREFAALGRPERGAVADGAERLEHARDDGGAAVAVQLDDVLAGERARRGEPEHERLVEHLARRRRVQPSHARAPRLGRARRGRARARGELAQRVEGLGPRDAQHRDARDAAPGRERVHRVARRGGRRAQRRARRERPSPRRAGPRAARARRAAELPCPRPRRQRERAKEQAHEQHGRRRRRQPQEQQEQVRPQP